MENKFDSNAKLDKKNKNINDSYKEKEKSIIEDKTKKIISKESSKKDNKKETLKKSKKWKKIIMNI